MGGISPNKPAATCVECLAWGVLPGSCCRACYTFRQLHGQGECAACRRIVPINKGHCRLCWLQALRDAKNVGQTHVTEPFLLAVHHQQLFFARMHRDVYRVPGRQRLGKKGTRGLAPPPAPATPRNADPNWAQPPLPFQAGHDFSRFDRRRHADLANPTLVRARQAGRALAASRGWGRWVAKDVDRALVVLLSNHTGDEKIRFTELAPALRHHGLTIERTVDVLTDLDLFHDDKTPAFDRWLDRKLGPLTPGIRHDVEAWLRVLHEGGPRVRARNPETAGGYLNHIRPLLLGWSDRFRHLREVTRQDVLDATDTLRGSNRHITLCVLRSLFRHCKKTGAIFRDPTTRIRPNRVEQTTILPLRPEDIHEAINAATTPADRLAVVLATVHAARSKDILSLRLDDVDIGNRRLVVAGRVRPLDDLTRHAVLDWLDVRRNRWPHTANLHLLINRLTALKSGPVSRVWITRAFWGLTATLERLHTDRQLEEALTHGPDPLHLTAVFGIHENTAIRYADAARHILETDAERHHPSSP
ncbi:integrase [Dactylosporangium darangshiense]|uniref:Core-binding (CB) domain-containing protein n=1 Tax=Dactylosporangium darangshiense TaxID=579108 RepID=A0ABP8DWN8_9ACTN